MSYIALNESYVSTDLRTIDVYIALNKSCVSTDLRTIDVLYCIK